MKLVIAEKPSVGLSIAKVIGAYERHEGYYEGSDYIVSWCFGHLVELAKPEAYDERYKKWRREDLPILPEHFQWAITSDKKDQFLVLKELMERDDVDELICATDTGREGELIFRLVYMKAECRKPFKRLWISSMEDKAIQDGFASLKDGHAYDNLYQAAVCRAEADWLVGINASRLFTTLYDKRLSVGRVQTPTLAMIVNRNREITDFQKAKYFNVHLNCDGLEVVKEKIFSVEEATALMEACNGAKASVASVKQTKKAVHPPKLYDLTTLQRECNQLYGYTAQRTLDLTQSLYEKKLVTYPRTDSQYLTEDMAETADAMVRAICRVFDFGHVYQCQADIQRIINNSKVTDHHAIIPTTQIETQDLSTLSEEEMAVLRLIAQKMLCATGVRHEYMETTVIVTCAGQEFKANGKAVLTDGWKTVETAFKNSLKDKPSEKEEAVLPPVAEGTAFPKVAAKLTEHFTTPPKQYTEATLLSSMETAGNDSFDENTEKKGIGTPATRASIIEKLVSSRYIQRKGKQLIPTEDGINLVSVLPDDVKSAKLTAEWENTLMQVERGKVQSQSFMDGIERMMLDLMQKYSTVSPEEQKRFGGKAKQEPVGTCPRCGAPIYEGQKNFYCSNKDCKFRLWKESNWLSCKKKRITKTMAAALLKDGRVFVRGIYSQRTGKTFDAYFVLEDTGQYVNLKLEFADNGNRNDSGGRRS